MAGLSEASIVILRYGGVANEAATPDEAAVPNDYPKLPAQPVASNVVAQRSAIVADRIFAG
ncbi:hypothetical protein A5711_00990 [Mycobacterium sp. E2238]|nr:hypothetical protein A5711_00990 [Mycobacterium sp. E2238]